MNTRRLITAWCVGVSAFAVAGDAPAVAGDKPNIVVILMKIMAAIDSGEIRVERGSKKDVRKFFGYFDRPVDIGSINLIVR